jgi:hypothetical protein
MRYLMIRRRVTLMGLAIASAAVGFSLLAHL